MSFERKGTVGVRSSAELRKLAQRLKSHALTGDEAAAAEKAFIEDVRSRQKWAERERELNAMYPGETERVRRRVDEERNQASVVAKLVRDPRRVLVCSCGHWQFKRFRDELFSARRDSGISVSVMDVQRVFREEAFWGIGPERFVLVLLDDWEYTADYNLKKQVHLMVRARGFEPLKT